MMKQYSIFDFPELLPDTALHIAAVIGEEAAEKLIENIGGARFKMGKGCVKTERLAILTEAIGEQTALQLLKVFGGEEMYIPRCEKAVREARNRNLLHDWQQSLDSGKSQLMTCSKLAVKYRISDRTIYTIVKAAKGKT